MHANKAMHTDGGSTTPFMPKRCRKKTTASHASMFFFLARDSKLYWLQR